MLYWEWDSTNRTTNLYVGDGQFGLLTNGDSVHQVPWPGKMTLERLSALMRWQSGPHWSTHWLIKTSAMVEVSVPLWAPGSASLLGALVLFYLDRRRRLPNSCPRCRYDLSATPPSAPCPECGEGGRAQQSPDAEAAKPAAGTTP
jgi:hypothetical protein